MEATILLGNHNDCKIDTGRYVETDVMGWKATIYVPSGIDNEQIQKALDYAYSTLCQSNKISVVRLEALPQKGRAFFMLAS